MKGVLAVNLVCIKMITLPWVEKRDLTEIEKGLTYVAEEKKKVLPVRVLWSSEPGAEPDIYLTKTINFGDKPAGCTAIVCLNKTAEMFGEENQDARRSLIKDNYVDDTISSAKALEKGIRAVAEKESFNFKPSVISGDDTERQT